VGEPRKHTTAAKVAATVALTVTAYEVAAVFTGIVPTVTEIIEQQLPEHIELAIIVALAGWLLHHFGWFARWR
jgi:hypothetical protein